MAPEPEERRIAPALHRTIAAMAKRFRAGEAADALEAWGTSELLKAGFAKVDYATIRHAATLQPIAGNGDSGRVLVAAWLGRTRLIDNVAT